MDSYGFENSSAPNKNVRKKDASRLVASGTDSTFAQRRQVKCADAARVPVKDFKIKSSQALFLYDEAHRSCIIPPPFFYYGYT